MDLSPGQEEGADVLSGVGETGKKPRETSTERVRNWRARQRELGGHASGMVLSANGQLALMIVMSHLKRPTDKPATKKCAIEHALHQEARRLCPGERDIAQLVRDGCLTPELAQAWRDNLETNAKAAPCEGRPQPAADSTACDQAPPPSNKP